MKLTVKKSQIDWDLLVTFLFFVETDAVFTEEELGLTGIKEGDIVEIPQKLL